jgi:hypothetical protein
MRRLIDYEFSKEITETYNIKICWNLVSIGGANGITINRIYFKVDEMDTHIFLHAENIQIGLSRSNSFFGVNYTLESINDPMKAIKVFKSSTIEEMKDLQNPVIIETIIETPLNNPEL